MNRRSRTGAMVLLSLVVAAGLVWFAAPSSVTMGGVGAAPSDVADRAAESAASATLLSPMDAGERPAAVPVGRRELSVAGAPVTSAKNGRHPSTVECPPRFSRLNFTVTDGQRPLENATVSLDDNVEHLFDAPTDSRGAALTDAEGRVSVYARGSRVVTVHATAPGPVGVSIIRGVTTPVDGHERDVDLTLLIPDLAGGIELLVVSERGGVPVAGVRVELDGVDGAITTYVSTDKNGRVLVPCGPRRGLRLVKSGFELHKMAMPELSAGTVLTAYLKPHARLFGRIGPVIGGAAGDSVGAPKARVQFFYEAEFQHSSPRMMELLRQMDRHRGDVQADGSWEINGVLPRDVRDPHFAPIRVFHECGPLRRQLALVEDMQLGDQYEVFDPWIGNRPLEIRFVNTDGELISPGGLLTLNYGEGLGALWTSEFTSPEVRIGLAGYGDWTYELARPGVFAGDAGGGFRGSLDHQGAGPLTVVLDLRELKGTLTWPRESWPNGLALVLVPRGSLPPVHQLDIASIRVRDPKPAVAIVKDPLSNNAVPGAERSELFRAEPRGSATRPFSIEGVSRAGAWDLLVMSPVDPRAGRWGSILERVPVMADLEPVNLVLREDR